MTDTAIFRDYTQAELDSQYDNRGHVPDHEEIYAARAKGAEAVLATFDTRLDVAFGPGPEETLDIYLPENPGANLPINVFLHGGYWFSRHKDDFRFMAKGLAARGGILVIVNYALIPSVNMTELVRQCRAAVAWTFENAATFGGDAGRIHVSGHSAGGHLTAMMMTTDWTAFGDTLPADLVKSGSAISGIYDLEPIRLGFMQETLGFTTEDVAAFSPIGLTPATKAPLIVSVGGSETDEFIRQSEEFVPVWKQAGINCSLMVVPGMNHFTILGEMAEADGALTNATAEMMGLG